MFTCTICGETFRQPGYHLLHKHGISTKRCVELGIITGCERHCEYCGEIFIPTKPYRRFCNIKCSGLSHRRSPDISLSNAAKEFIDGCLLGDGCIALHKKKACYGQASKFPEYLEWIESQLASFGIYKTGRIYKREHNHNGNIYYSYQLVSLSYSDLIEIRKRWYSPNNGKQPPLDLILTPAMIRQWFMDDGSFRRPKMRPHSSNNKLYLRRASVRLCNSSFTMKNKEFLASQLHSFGLEITIHDNWLYIPVGSTARFFDVIGSCPVPEIFGYKWP